MTTPCEHGRRDHCIECEASDLRKHADCLRRTGHHAISLPPSLYAAAEKQGYDMSDYVVQRLLPMIPDKPGALVERKHISNRTCHGKEVACLPGRRGKCVACCDDD